MHRSLLNWLVDPLSGAPLKLRAEGSQAEEVEAGALVAGPSSYPIRQGIPRFVLTEEQGQRQTSDSFGFKWQQRGSYDSEAFRQANRDWLVRRYGFAEAYAMRDFFAQHAFSLDAGCGAAFSSSLWMTPDWQQGSAARWLGADISEAVDVARDRVGAFPGTDFVQADVLQLPFAEDTFDLIFSEGVLHHTPSTRLALHRLTRLLKVGGHFLFYVYRKKAPIREFTDDWVREAVAGLSPEEAWEALRPLTRLGQALADLRVAVDIPEDVPVLGIKAGKMDVQRFIYWNIAKLYWRDTFTFEENHHVNFDWYHPRYAHRHTPEEVLEWCREEHLTVEHIDVQESGITVRAVKSAA
jgi:SAM-dependent methyltransferase